MLRTGKLQIGALKALQRGGASGRTSGLRSTTLRCMPVSISVRHVCPRQHAVSNDIESRPGMNFKLLIWYWCTPWKEVCSETPSKSHTAIRPLLQAVVTRFSERGGKSMLQTELTLHFTNMHRAKFDLAPKLSLKFEPEMESYTRENVAVATSGACARRYMQLGTIPSHSPLVEPLYNATNFPRRVLCWSRQQPECTDVVRVHINVTGFLKPA